MDGLVSKQKWAARTATFLGDKSKQDNKNRTAKHDKHYEPNVECMRAIDHQLQSMCGFGLKAFTAERPPQPLGQHERRYWAPASSLPEALAVAGGHLSRSCIENTETGEKRLEVLWGNSRKMLIEVIDTGSIGYPAKFWMGTKGLLRHVWYRDPCHLKNNRFRSAITEAGLKNIWQEAQVIFGLRKGPWSGAAHFGGIKACCDFYFKQCDHTDALFRLCYPFIIHDFYEGQLPTHAFAEQHCQEIWDWLPRCPVFHHHGAKTIRSRWYQPNEQCEEMRKYFGAWTLILLRMGIEVPISSKVD